MSAAQVPPPVKFHLSICGGGIAGLALACTLGKYTDPAHPCIDVDLYEAGPEITTVGAGISVWSRTWQIMRLLGLEDELAQAAVDPPAEGEKPGFVFRRSDRAKESYNFYSMMVPRGATTMHRADMVDVLVRNLPAFCKIRTSKRLLSYTESANGKICLHFADGTNEETDVLVGADGVKSATRKAMYDIKHAKDCRPGQAREDCDRCSAATPWWTGTVAYRSLISAERLSKVRPNHRALYDTLSWSGKSKHVITYPVSHGKAVNCVAFVTIPGGEGTRYPEKWVKEVSKEEFLSQYQGWERELQELLECVENPSLWAIHVIRKLPFCVSGQVALIGDAVHAMTTHFGAGAGQAIEDAYILGRLLADPRTSLLRVESALKAYEAIRLPFANAIVERAHITGMMYEFNGPESYDGSARNEEEERVALGELGEKIRKQWSWQWQTPVDVDWCNAIARYEESLASQE